VEQVRKLKCRHGGKTLISDLTERYAGTVRVKQPESIMRFLQSRFEADDTKEPVSQPVNATDKFKEDGRASFRIYEFGLPPPHLHPVSKTKEWYGAAQADWREGWQGIPLEALFNCIVTKTPLVDTWEEQQVVYIHDTYAKARTNAVWVNLFDDGSLIKAVLDVRFDVCDGWTKKQRSYHTIRPRSAKIASILIEIMDAKEIELGEPLQLIWDATLEICPEKVRAASERPDPQAASASQSSQGAMPPGVGQDKSGAGQGVWGAPEKEPPQRPKDEEGDVEMAGPEEE